MREKPGPEKPGAEDNRLRHLRSFVFSRRFLGLLVILGILAATILTVPSLRSWFSSSVVRALGLGFFLGLLGVIIVLLVWAVNWARRQWFFQHWNWWLGGLALFLAFFGFLAYFKPDWTLGSVSLKESSLGGALGQAILRWGNERLGFLWVILLAFLGFALVAPRATFHTLREGAQALGRFVGSSFPRRPAPAPPASSLRRFLRLPPKEPPRTAPPAPVAPSKEELAKRAEKQPRLPGLWPMPTLDLLEHAPERELSPADNAERARRIEEALAEYNVEAKVVQINPGPVVTRFDVEPGWDRRYRQLMERDTNGRIRIDKDGRPRVRREEVSRTRVRVERIAALANDLSLALSAPSIRILTPVPGKPVVGLEVPNTVSDVVPLRGVIESSAFQRLKGKTRLPLALGKGAAGEAVVADLSKMPHLLIAGATGSGKTVCLNAIIATLLLYSSPENLRLILIDPKRVEMTLYQALPHLITPVLVEGEEVEKALRKLMLEMDNRFKRMAAAGARNIEAFNKDPRRREPMPYLVLVIDELADLMFSHSEVVEPHLCRLAQMARATGIHLIVATQRPSVDVVTGLIKANFPARISFQTTSQVDSRVILDVVGAEKLVGRGDMLFKPPDTDRPRRLQGCFVSDAELEKLVDFWKKARGIAPAPNGVAQSFASLPVPDSAADDAMLEEARKLAATYKRLSTTFLQHKLGIGYPRAARLMDALEREGIVAPGETGKPRQVLRPITGEGEPREDAPRDQK